MNTPKPQYGFQLCAADDKERTHYLCHCGVAMEHGVWRNDNDPNDDHECGRHWQKPIPSPDGLPWERSEWELVPLNESPTEDGREFKHFRKDDNSWTDWGNATRFSTCREAIVAFPLSLAFARRKQPARIQPGEGWRLLEPGERIEEGDEYWSLGLDKWEPSGDSGRDVESRENDFTYRRRIKPAAEQNQGRWVSVKERLPDKGTTVLVWSSDKPQGAWLVPECCPLNWVGVTHWMPLPPPPAPEKSEAEAAWEKFVEREPTVAYGSGSYGKDIFLAGYAAKGGVR